MPLVLLSFPSLNPSANAISAISPKDSASDPFLHLSLHLPGTGHQHSRLDNHSSPCRLPAPPWRPPPHPEKNPILLLPCCKNLRSPSTGPSLTSLGPPDPSPAHQPPCCLQTHRAHSPPGLPIPYTQTLLSQRSSPCHSGLHSEVTHIKRTPPAPCTSSGACPAAAAASPPSLPSGALCEHLFCCVVVSSSLAGM